MADPKLETILAAIQTQLETITTGNGYHNTVTKVSRNLQGLLTEDDVPALYMVAGRCRATPGTNMEYTFNRNVRIIGVQKSDQDVDGSGLLQIELVKLEKDIFNCMHVDFQFGLPNLIDHTFFKSAEPLYDWQQLRGYVQMDFDVQYHHTYQAA